jgi:hypothetical protein
VGGVINNGNGGVLMIVSESGEVAGEEFDIWWENCNNGEDCFDAMS